MGAQETYRCERRIANAVLVDGPDGVDGKAGPLQQQNQRRQRAAATYGGGNAAYAGEQTTWEAS